MTTLTPETVNASLNDHVQETNAKIRHLDNRATKNAGDIDEVEAVNTAQAALIAALTAKADANTAKLDETYELLLLLCRHFASFTVYGTEHQLNQRDRTEFAAQISRILAERAAAENSESESESPAGQQAAAAAPTPAPEATPPPAPTAPTHDSSQDSS